MGNGCWNCNQQCLPQGVYFGQAGQGGLYEGMTFKARSKGVRCRKGWVGWEKSTEAEGTACACQAQGRVRLIGLPGKETKSPSQIQTLVT